MHEPYQCVRILGVSVSLDMDGVIYLFEVSYLHGVVNRRTR